MVTIEVCERLMDCCWRYEIDAEGEIRLVKSPAYHACIADKPGCWERGTSIDDAIGNLVRTHPEHFGVQLVYLEGAQAR